MPEKVYIGTKIIAAEPMNENRWLDSQGKLTVGKEDRPGYRVRYRDGYVSWSPKEEFELAYREISDAEIDLLLSRA